MSKYQTDEFLQLQAKWYEKLEKKGFDDIEQADGNLKKGHYRAHLAPHREEYFRLAGRFLHDNKFVNSTEKSVWKLHSEGETIRGIAAKLDTPSRRMYTKKLQPLLKRLVKQMLTLYRVGDNRVLDPKDE